MPPPLQRLLRRLRLGGGYGPQVAVAPRLGSLVSPPLLQQLPVCLLTPFIQQLPCFPPLTCMHHIPPVPAEQAAAAAAGGAAAAGSGAARRAQAAVPCSGGGCTHRRRRP